MTQLLKPSYQRLPTREFIVRKRVFRMAAITATTTYHSHVAPSIIIRKSDFPPTMSVNDDLVVII